MADLEFEDVVVELSDEEMATVVGSGPRKIAPMG